jgi:hypothetical protein
MDRAHVSLVRGANFEKRALRKTSAAETLAAKWIERSAAS